MNQGYNERLFSGNSLRNKLHFSMYNWLKKKALQYFPDAKSVLELGCFDGKALHFLPSAPEYYEGYDANWENGLETARKIWAGNPNTHFVFCDTIADFAPEEGRFDISICMETLEHLPTNDLEKYISNLRKATKTFSFITVPNERGIVCVLKYLSKKIMYGYTPESYSGNDLFNAFLGKMSDIQRSEGGHKGFDYLKLIELLKQYFNIAEIEGIPFRKIPVSLNFTVGIVLEKQ